jgi:hypothetical protein
MVGRPPAKEKRKQFATMWNRGDHARAIAAALGYQDVNSVYAVAGKWGMPPRGQRRSKRRKS